ncbi:MAG: Ig-like domain-containing protein, partial [Nevskiales bacterium]
INATGTVAGGAGEAMVTFTAGTSPGSAVITASFSGVSATLALDVISTDPDSINVQAQPNVVNVNGQTTIQAVVRDPSSNPVASQTVTFTVSNGPGNVSPGVGVTNSQGVVTTTYTAPSQPTASNGVTVTATVQSDPGVTGSTTLTVGGQALHISIGTGITISDDGVARYNLPYSVLVNDSNGNPPAAGTNVNLQVLSLRFYEGFYVEGPGSRWVPVSDPNDDDNLEPKTGCDSEDVNFNGVLNPGEDTHIAGPYQNPPAPTLAPGNVASVPGTLALNTGGTADFFVNYNKAFCSWVQVRLQATTAVAGTEASAVATFDLPCSTTDLGTSHAPPGGSIDSPFGTDGNCTTAPLEPTACSDGVDNDSDAFTDFPNDAQCSSAADDSESACSDGMDNDLDTFVDFPDDAQCSDAADNDEAA